MDLDVVVNNAATFQVGNVEHLNDAGVVVGRRGERERTIARPARPFLTFAHGAGSIVNVSSIGGLFAAKISAVYGTTRPRGSG